MRVLASFARLLPFAALVPAAAFAQPSFLNFESGQVRPLALSDDGERLFVVNTPDNRLEIVDLTGDVPAIAASVGVGLEPVAVAVESPGRVWVVNHLSDSVSIVDVEASPPRVLRTLWVGDEPRDIVFAGTDRRAFITTAHRGQNTDDPRGAYNAPGVGRADVWVFDTENLGGTHGTALSILTLFGDVPRALTVSPDGSRVYVATFLSGNRTTAVAEGAVCNGGSEEGPCNVEGTEYPGGLPAPNVNHEGTGAPEVGLIVRQNAAGGPWLDELGRDWSAAVRFELPDNDVFALDANANPPALVESFDGVGTALFAMAVHPTSGEVYVANTEARNEVRFEGPGEFVRSLGLRDGQPSTVRGHLHEARVTRIGDSVTPVHLNPHIDYEGTPSSDVRWRTLSTPTALAFSADGATLYVAAMGSSAIGIIDASRLNGGTLETGLERMIHLRDPWPGGPTGLVVDDARNRLYVLTRFDNTVVTIDLSDRSFLGRLRMPTPEDEATVVGRPILYDALATSSNGESACGSCHVFGDLDGLAWDLGNPDGNVMSNPNPRGPVGSGADFHPMKGPMTTQSLRGLADHGPMHWRGDRTGGTVGGDPMDEIAAFVAFNEAFDGLLGRDEGELSEAEMRRFAEFAVRIMYPPNPIRRLDNSLREDEQRGSDLYGHTDSGAPRFDGVATCDGCHTLDRSGGFFGSDGRTTFENEPQEFKVAHLRNLYQKVGMFGMPSVPFIDNSTPFGSMGPQIRGFGYLHDGSIDTVDRFFHATVFSMSTRQRDDIVAFMMAFDATLPPIVGQQASLGSEADADAEARVALLQARANATMVWPGGTMTRECDLIARGVIGGEDRGYLLEDDGLFHSDRSADAALSLDDLRAALADGDVLTFTCAPPGSGPRMAYDRDEDGARDRDEIDDGTDPADRPPITIPRIEVPPPGPGDDAGVLPDGGLDAGVRDVGTGTDSGPGGVSGGGCAVASTSSASGLWLLLFLWRRRS
ncbi:MAG: hypothetical protein AAGE52_33595 [Myxococcota bacterium]